MSHEMVQIDVADLSIDQREMLTLRLRGLDVAHEFAGSLMSLPEARAGDARRELAWIRANTEFVEHDAPPMPHPFRRTLPNGRIVASRGARGIGAWFDATIMNFWFALGNVADLPQWSLVVLIIGYQVVFTRAWGRTLGKFVVGTEVIDAEGARLSLGQCVVRSVLLSSPLLVALAPRSPAQVALSLALGALVLPVLWDSRGQGLHDRAARTFVVSRER